MAKSLWHSPTETPDIDWDYVEKYDSYQSVRVIAEWGWDNPINGQSPQELRFAQYLWGNNKVGYWRVDGIAGSITIKRWFNPQEVK